MRLTNWIALLPCSAALSTALLGACTQQTAPFVEAVHSPLPLMQYQGGPLITSPRIFTVSFADDAHQSDEQRFDDQLTTSVYWKSVTDGYCDGGGACIGPGVSAGGAVLPQSTATLNALTWPSDFEDNVLGPALANGKLPPTADDLLCVFYVPTDSPLGGVRVGGYHGGASFPPSPGVLGPVVRYAVVKGYNLAVAAHEIVESATDWDGAGAAWIMPDSAFASYFFGDEVGDICALDNYVTTDAGRMPRMWSNASAIAGHNPCVPGPPGEIYFNVAPETQSVHLSVGQTTTVTAVAFSDAPIHDWILTAEPRDSALEVSVSPTSVNNGTKVTVTVTLKKAPANPYVTPTFALTSSFVGGGDYPPANQSTEYTPAFHWPVAVLTP